MATPRAPHEHGRIPRPSPLSECGSAVTLTHARPRTRRAVEHPRRKLLPPSPIGAVQRATEINAIRLRDRRMDMNVQAKPRMPPIENFADNGPVGVLKPCCTMDGDPTPALTGRRRTRPPSP